MDMPDVESGSMGRVAYARIGPNEDLVQGVEKLCLAEGFRNAFVRGALGSLVDACLYTRDGGYRHVSGPAVEIVSLAGEVRAQPDGSLTASLSGVVADPQGRCTADRAGRQSHLHDLRGHARGMAAGRGCGGLEPATRRVDDRHRGARHDDEQAHGLGGSTRIR